MLSQGHLTYPGPGLPASQPPSSFGGGLALLETKRGQASGEAAGASSLLNRPSFSFLSLGADEAEGETGWGTGGGDGIRIHTLPVGLTSVSPEAKPANPFLYLLCDWGLLPDFMGKNPEELACPRIHSWILYSLWTLEVGHSRLF